MGRVSIEQPVDVPPQNLEAEEAVLGAMLVSDGMLRRVRVETGLRPRHFYLEKHGEIYAEMQRLADREGRCDELMLGNALPVHRDYLAELVAKVGAAGNAPHYAKIIVRKAQQRAKIEGARLILEGAREDDEKGDEKIQAGLELAASDFIAEAEPTTSDEIMMELLQWLDDPADPEVFVLPWPKLNESLAGGFRRKQMSVLAGWPKSGKSFFLDQAMGAFRDQGKRCAIFALEVSRQERAARWITMSTGIPFEKILLKQLNADDYTVAVKAMRKGLPFDYFEAAEWGVNRIAERIIYGGYDVVAIDPVTKIPGFEKTEVASAAVGRFTGLAVRANCHVILVSHLNKSRGLRENGVRPRPVVGDLRGSGMIEGDAHAILFLHREQDNHANVLPKGEAYFDRSRLGPPVGMKIEQRARTLTFHPPAQPPKQEALDLGNVNGHDRSVI